MRHTYIFLNDLNVIRKKILLIFVEMLNSRKKYDYCSQNKISEIKLLHYSAIYNVYLPACFCSDTHLLIFLIKDSPKQTNSKVSFVSNLIKGAQILVCDVLNKQFLQALFQFFIS